MSESQRCPHCHAEIPANWPVGLCPRCLLRTGADSQSEILEPVVSSELRPTKITPQTSGFVPPIAEELAPLFPQLEILELLGKGGMGAVYKARQPGLDRLVAVKILPPEISRDPAFAERFQREARALARLNHPHIVAVYDFGTTGSGIRENSGGVSEVLRTPRQDCLCYIVMEFVDGANLRQAIKAGKLAPGEALAIVPQICEALQFAHDEGIVHRDIKPENILIDKRGRVKIADFGLAKLLGQDASDHSLTATHQVMGTLRYMAPEQMQGSREVDHRADIYSLGVVFYELLTGELPMGRFAPPSKRVQVDVRLDEVVLRALEQDPDQRYQHASEVKSDLEAVCNSSSAVDVVRHSSSENRPADLYERVVAVLRRDKIAAIKLYLDLTGAGLDEARLAVETIGKLHGVQDPASRRQDLLWKFVLVTVAVVVACWWAAEAKGTSLYRNGVMLVSLVLAIAWYVFVLLDQRCKRAESSVSRGTPLTQLRFLVTVPGDIAQQAVFHFSSLGYELAEKSAEVCVFRRGGQWAGLWETDIRKIATQLTVRTAPATEGQWVSCDWSVRTLGAWITRRDIRQLEAEGEGFKALLGVPLSPDAPTAGPQSEPRFSRFAILGAVWALFGLLTIIPVLYFIGLNRVWNGTALPTDIIYEAPPLAFTIFMGALLAIGAGAPIGTTIYGAIAIGHIKRSRGRLYGLPLAMADALFFPLLVVGAVAFYVTNLIAFTVVFNLQSDVANTQNELTVYQFAIFDALVALLVCFFVGRAVWRAITGYQMPPTGPMASA